MVLTDRLKVTQKSVNKITKTGSDGAVHMPNTSIFEMASLCLEYLTASGYEVSDSVLTKELQSEIESMAGRAPVTSVLSCRGNYWTEQNSFWLLLRYQGVLVGTLGARLDHVGVEGFGDHVNRLHEHFFSGEGSTIIDTHLPQSVGLLTGGSVYMGDVFFANGHRGDVAKTQSFCQYAFTLAFSRWWGVAERLFALHREADALDGKVDEYGFTSGRYTFVQKWVNPPNGRSDSEHLSLLTKEHYLRNIGTFIERPERLLNPPTLRRSQGARKSPLRNSKQRARL